MIKPFHQGGFCAGRAKTAFREDAGAGIIIGCVFHGIGPGSVRIG